MACQRHPDTPCDCTFVAGESVAVVGTNPIVISRTAVGSLDVLDTPSVDFILNGNGTVLAPHQLSGEVVLGALLSFDASGGVEFDVSGAGTTLDPLRVTAWLGCLTCADPALDGQVPMMHADGSYRPQTVPIVPSGAVVPGAGVAGDGSGGNPLRYDICTYDELAAACATVT